MLDALFHLDGLRAAAADAVGSDAGSDDLDLGPFEAPLAVLLDALGREAALYPARAWRTLDNLTEELTLRAGRRRLLAAHPEIAEIPVRAPVFITGLPRSGTTLLHNLLARAPGWRAWRLWEMRAPLPVDDEAAAIAASQFEIDALYQRVPAFKKIHPLHAEGPDECSWLLRHAFSSLVLAFQYYIPSYRQHLCTHDQAPAYADYKRWLQVLSHRAPGGRLILKDPCHLWHLDALLSVFPDATILHLHRDPAEAVPSLASLCHTLQSMDAAQTNPKVSGAEALALVEAGAASVARARATVGASARIVDIPYRKLVERPLEVLGALLGELGMEPDVGPSSAWLEANRQHKAGVHAYTPEMFGMRADDLRERFAGV